MNEYNKNASFKHYVDAYCKKHEISVEEALTHELVKTVEKYYKENREASETE